MIELKKSEPIEDSITPTRYYLSINGKDIQVETFDDEGSWDWIVVGGNYQLTDEEYDDLMEFMWTYQQ